MAVAWTKHRFSGGVLALDTTNTVVHRGDPARQFDRFDDPAEIGRFATAATGFRANEFAGRALCASDPRRIADTVLAIREATDRLCRAAALRGQTASVHLPGLLRACADGLEGQGASADDIAQPLPFEAALAASALALLSADTPKRLRICPNCNWLFLDRSRNGSRLWCDMTVCGNRNKARRHYVRRKALLEA